MKKKLLLAVLATIGVFATAAPREAEAYGYHQPRASRYGFRHRIHGYVGAQVTGFAIAAQVTDYNVGYLSHGGGGGVFGGIRLGPFISIEANFGITYHSEAWDAGNVTIIDLDSIYMVTATADLKIHIPTRGIVEPFFQAGVGYAGIGVTNVSSSYAYETGGLFAEGLAFNVGGGLDVWLGPWVSIGGRALYRGLRFGEPKYKWNGAVYYSNFVNGVSVDLFLAFHF
jgi:hypothetical protein